MVFLVFSKSGCSKTIFFSRKRWFRTKKTIFFSRKPKKPSLEGPSPIVLEKMVFLVFLVFLVFSRKRWFLVRNHLFLEKMIVLSNHPSKNHLFLEKKMVLPGEDLQKPSFSREKDGFTRTRPPETIFFSRKRWFFQGKISKNHLFLEKKMVFRRAAAQEPSFSREKDGFEPKKPSFSRENQKNHLLEAPAP